RRAMGELHFAHALDDGPPEITKRGEWFRGQDRLVEHLPDNSQLYQRTGPPFARDETVGEANEFEEALPPGSDADFDVDPCICFRGEEIGGHAVGFSSRFLRASR